MSADTPTRRIPAVLIWLAVPVAVAVLAFIWWTASPLFISTRIDEAFPTTAPTAQVAPTAAPAAQVAPTAAPAAQVAPTAAPAAQVAPTAAPAAQVAPTAVPSEPIALVSGDFTVIDQLHGASGVATIYQQPDGQRLLRLEGFKAQNGPDLRIGLAAHPMPRSSAELHDTGAGYFELEGLKASEGSQNYALPADLDLVAYKSIVIYCRAFSVVFSTAELN